MVETSKIITVVRHSTHSPSFESLNSELKNNKNKNV